MAQRLNRGRQADPRRRCGDPVCGHVHLHHQGAACAIAGCGCAHWVEPAAPRRRSRADDRQKARALRFCWDLDDKGA